MNTTLFEDLEAQRFTFHEMDGAYNDGIEDTCDKVIELITQSDYSITLEELVSFLEAEKGWGTDAKKATD